MVKCSNEKCKNFGEELDETLELCPVCGMKTEKSVSKTKNNLAAIVSIASVISILIFWGVHFWVGIGLSVICIVLAFISRSKPAVVITILSLAAIIGLFVSVFQ